MGFAGRWGDTHGASHGTPPPAHPNPLPNKTHHCQPSAFPPGLRALCRTRGGREEGRSSPPPPQISLCIAGLGLPNCLTDRQHIPSSAAYAPAAPTSLIPTLGIPKSVGPSPHGDRGQRVPAGRWAPKKDQKSSRWRAHLPPPSEDRSPWMAAVKPWKAPEMALGLAGEERGRGQAEDPVEPPHPGAGSTRSATGAAPSPAV